MRFGYQRCMIHLLPVVYNPTTITRTMILSSQGVVRYLTGPRQIRQRLIVAQPRINRSKGFNDPLNPDLFGVFKCLVNVTYWRTLNAYNPLVPFKVAFSLCVDYCIVDCSVNEVLRPGVESCTNTGYTG